MSVSKEEYAAMVRRTAPPSPLGLDCLKAFLVGGAVCCFAQGVTEALCALRLPREDAKLLAMMKCLMYVLQCKKILTVIKTLATGVAVLVLACTAAKVFLLQDGSMKKIGKTLKKVMK